MNDDTTTTPPPSAWARFRRSRWYWQTAGWLFLAPVVLVVLTLSKPKAQRGRWWALVGIVAVAYIAIGASGGSDTKKTTVAAEGTASAEVESTTTEKAEPSTTEKATTTTVPKTTTTTVPKTTTTTPPSIRGTGKVTEARLGAFDVCKQFVSDRLKAPSGAKWRDPFGDQVSYVGDGKGPITVDASVDSENSFGAKIRSTYTCTVTNTAGENWHLDGLDFQDGGGS